MAKKRRKSRNYLNNRDLYDQMVLSKDQDVLTKEAEKMLILIAERAINKMKYVSEDDRNDCLQFAILDLLKYWRNFNPIYPNAFAYFTEIAKRGYAKGWNKIHPKKYKGTLSMTNHNGNSESQTGIYSI
jgi:DNA-directed RNA polymerase specialized sigma subunit|tara:strand:+ start:138 stop:524 length:387 start_codon:yes stop_codon:yes gene_type:complete